MSKAEDKFVRGRYQVNNWEAMTGIGRLDANFDPASNTLSVTFRVCMEFSDHDQKWRDDEKLAWQNRAFRIVEDFWTDRYRFKCMRPGWEKREVNVSISILPATMQTAHLHLRVSKLPPDWGTSGGGIGWTGLNGSGVPYCGVDNMCIEPKDQRKIREGIFNLRLYELAKGLEDRNVAVIPFAKDSATIPPEYKLRLLDYARYAHRIATPDVTGIEVYVFGNTGGTDKVMQTGLGLRRAKAVKDLLNMVIKDETMVHATVRASKKPGLKQAVLGAISKHAGGPTTSTALQGACIVTHVPATVDRAAEANYIVLCHEFGHMLGLPDEYMGRLHPKLTERVNMDTLVSKTLTLSTKSGDPTTWNDSDQRKADQQAGMAELLRYNVDIRSPTFMDQNQVIDSIAVSSPSIMYGGMEVMPAHYLTLWSCLSEMTWKHMSPTHWKIVPSPARRIDLRYFG